MKKETFYVKGMMCAHCEARVTNALSALDGVKSVKASAKKGEVTVKYEEAALSSDTIRTAITETGYEVLA